MRKFALSVFTILMLCFQVVAQNQRVTGTVTNAAGAAIQGATVIVEGTQNAVTTGTNGEYTLNNVPSDATLRFAYLGSATQSVAVNGQTVVNVRMHEEATDITEVVVVGYGSGRRQDAITGDPVTVSSDVLSNKPSATIADALQGQVAGMSVTTPGGAPNQTSDIVVHGIGSFNASSSPLLVIDGMPSAWGMFARLNPQDLESVTVLKDASSTSIYGSRAANGVLYVTTKKGHRNQDATIVVNGYWGISTPTTSKHYNPMPAEELLKWQLEFNEISQDRYNDYLNDFVARGRKETDWFSYFFEDAPTYSTDVSISGGTDKTSYLVSGSYMYKDGIAPRSFFDRYTFRASVTTQAKPWLNFGANMNMSYDSQTSVYAAATSSGISMNNPSFLSRMMPSYWSGYEADGRYSPRINNTYTNPHYIAEKNPVIQDGYVFSGNLFMDIKPIENLTLRSQGGLEAWYQTVEGMILPSFMYQNTGGRSRTLARSGTFSITNTAEYKFNVNEDHAFTVLVGQEGVVDHAEDWRLSAEGMIEDKMMLIGNGTESNIGMLSESASSYAFLSFFGRVNYDLKNKYFFDATVRNDASSRFGRNNRNALFYSLGAMWNMKREKFLEDVDALDALRVRVNYGTQGNSEIGNYSHLSLVGSTMYGGIAGWGLGSPGNPNLGWENQTLFNVSVEFGAWKWLTGNIGFYNRLSTDCLYDVPISMTTGFSSIMRNDASLLNRGIDVELGAQIFRNDDWRVSARTTFNYNYNEVKKLYGDVQEQIFAQAGVIHRVGSPIFSFYQERFMGVDPRDGLPMYDDGYGNPTKNVDNAGLLLLTGKNQIAPITGGFDVNAGWKGFDLGLSFAYKLNQWNSFGDRFFMEDTENGVAIGLARPDYMRNIWREPGDVTDIPKYGARIVGYADDKLEDTSFLRLKNISLSYSLPQSLMEKTGFLQGAKVYFIGRNLLTFTGYTGYDPEITGNVNYGAYPMTKEYTFGLELTF